MKIAIFTETYEPYVSGVVTSVKFLKETLERMHHEVYIITANLKRNRFEYDEKKRIIYIPGIKTGIGGAKLTKTFSRKAYNIIKTWNLDVIHCQTEFGIGAFSRKVAKKLNIPVVHTYHTLYEDYVHYVTHGFFNNFGKKIAIKLTKHYCENCEELIVPTEKIKRLFIDKYGINREIHVIPTGIDLEKFDMTDQMEKDLNKLRKKYKLSEKDFIIGSIGRVAKEKSLDRLIRSTRDIIDKYPFVKLIIGGDGPELENLKRQAKELQMEKYIIFTGMIDYKDVPTYYHLFNIMSSFSVTETQGLTIIEALATQVPVVCINDKSFREMVQDKYNGYLVEDELDYINKVEYLINNEKVYKEMSVNAKNSVFKYSKEVFASDVLKVYAKAIEEKK